MTLPISACELARLIHSKQISVSECVAACFEQIEEYDSSLKAFVTLCRERAEAEAVQADRAIARGETLSVLQGIPFAVKDLTPTAGVRTTYGSAIYKSSVPNADELCIERLRRAGGILIGKTNTPEFGLGAQTNNVLCGPTANPYALNRSSGGSSGGSAVAVAAGMAFLAQGTDMGGSVRTPASFCGVVGLRPSAGRIPRPNKRLQWDYLDTDGILARTVEDAALMLSVMAGGDRRDPISIPSRWSIPEFFAQADDPLQIRVGFSPDLGIAVIDAEVAAVFQEAIARLAPLCPVVAEDHPDCSLAQEAFETIRAATLLHKQKHHYKKYREQLSQSVVWNIERGIGISAADLLQAQANRDRLTRSFLRFFERYDVLATVSASVPPFPLTQPEVLEIGGVKLRNIIDYLTITYTISLTGLPALSIPCGRTQTGLPVGMQLVGKPHGEATLLQFAYALQERLNFCYQPPILEKHSALD